MSQVRRPDKGAKCLAAENSPRAWDRERSRAIQLSNSARTTKKRSNSAIMNRISLSGGLPRKNLLRHRGGSRNGICRTVSAFGIGTQRESPTNAKKARPGRTQGGRVAVRSGGGEARAAAVAKDGH